MRDVCAGRWTATDDVGVRDYDALSGLFLLLGQRRKNRRNWRGKCWSVGGCNRQNGRCPPVWWVEVVRPKRVLAPMPPPLGRFSSTSILRDWKPCLDSTDNPTCFWSVMKTTEFYHAISAQSSPTFQPAEISQMEADREDGTWTKKIL